MSMDSQSGSTRTERLIDDFLEYLEIVRGRSTSTINRYRHYLKRFLEWLYANFGNKEIEDVNHDLISKYRLYLARVRDTKGKQLKRSTQVYHLIALRSFLRYLSVHKDLPVLSPEKIELPKQGMRSVVFLNSEQVERLLNSPEISSKVGLRDKAILETLFSTGLRVSELVSLNRDQVDLKRREFSVKGKGDKTRVVFLSDTAAEWLQRYLETRRDDFSPLFIRYSGSVDHRLKGEKMRLTARSVQRIVERYARKCGLPLKVTPHILRHSFATDLLMGGADLRSVQEMLGHESIRTTQVYTHVTNKHLKEVHQTYHSRYKQQ